MAIDRWKTQERERLTSAHEGYVTDPRYAEAVISAEARGYRPLTLDETLGARNGFLLDGSEIFKWRGGNWTKLT